MKDKRRLFEAPEPINTYFNEYVETNAELNRVKSLMDSIILSIFELEHNRVINEISDKIKLFYDYGEVDLRELYDKIIYEKSVEERLKSNIIGKWHKFFSSEEKDVIKEFINKS